MNPTPRHGSLIGCAIALALISACTLHRIEPTAPAAATVPPRPMPTPRPTPPPQPTSLPSPRTSVTTPPVTVLSSADQALLNAARSQYQRARTTIPDWQDQQIVAAQLNAAQQAARSGDAAGLRGLASAVLQRSQGALDARDQQLAQLELQKLQTYTGLSRLQTQRMHEAEVILASGQFRRAYTLLSALTEELANATQRYVVAAGDSLWIISGKPSVYGNPKLWPLIWEANLSTVRDPNQLLKGQRLKIRTNPTIDEVVQALETAREYSSPTVTVGEIEAAP